MEKEKKNNGWKDLMVAELTEKIEKNSNFYISDYLGLKADEINELRRLLEPSSSRYVVLKNSIARIAFNNAGLQALAKLINGGTGIVLSGDDPVETAKAVSKFGKTHGALKIKGGYLDGNIIDVEKMQGIFFKKHLLNLLMLLLRKKSIIQKHIYFRSL